jgi:hypothetical protein
MTKYKRSLTEYKLTSVLSGDRTITNIFCRGGRTGTKVHIAYSGSSCLGCGHWCKHLVNNWQVTAAQADKMTRCEKCFSAEWLALDAPTPVALPDATVIQTLGQLNAMLKPEAQGWVIRRSPAGYYYMTHEIHAPSDGIYVFSCKGTTLGFWRRELAAVIEGAR